MVKIPNSQIEENDDFLKMMMDLEPVFSKHSRHYLNVIDFQDYYYKHINFCSDLVRFIPQNIQAYLENNNIFAYDIEGDDYGTQKSIQCKLKDSVSNLDDDIRGEVIKRDSMVGLKNYINDIKQIRYSETSHEEFKHVFKMNSINQEKEAPNDDQSQRSSFSNESSEELLKPAQKWFIKRRKLSYTNIRK